jgi:microsomal dipeptidase-like Zn-dependent dipeptidase
MGPKGRRSQGESQPKRAMLADLHAHYPMHLAAERHLTLRDILRRSNDGVLAEIKALVLGFANRIANFESFFSGPRVTIPLMVKGNVGLALSVLYVPFDEMDLSEPYGAPPKSQYARDLVEQLELIEADISQNHGGQAVIAHNATELVAGLGSDRVTLVHCVEGGFHLGHTAEEIRRNVAELRGRGVCYVTLAHLFWRRIATNAPAIPFLSDGLYDDLFPQPKEGLTELGRAAVAAMLDHRVLIDVSHMSETALQEVFALLDEHDPARKVPVLATHAGCRFGSQHYNLSDETVRRIANRGGVIGLILADHQIRDGLRRTRPKTFSGSFRLLCQHIDRIRELTGSHRHVAIGSDLDGFIKPTLSRLGNMAQLRQLEQALRSRYGDNDVELITSHNIIRLLQDYWA